MKAFFQPIFLVFFLSLFSPVAFATEPPSVVDPEGQALGELRKVLSEKLRLPLLDLGMPKVTLQLKTCRLESTERNAQYEWDYIYLQFFRGDVRWSFAMNGYTPSRSYRTGDEFVFESYTETCEEEGCDGNWYVDHTVTVGPNFIRMTHVEPYTMRTSSATCEID